MPVRQGNQASREDEVIMMVTNEVLNYLIKTNQIDSWVVPFINKFMAAALKKMPPQVKQNIILMIRQRLCGDCYG